MAAIRSACCPKQGHAAWRMETVEVLLHPSVARCQRPKQGHAAWRMETTAALAVACAALPVRNKVTPPGVWKLTPLNEPVRVVRSETRSRRLAYGNVMTNVRASTTTRPKQGHAAWRMETVRAAPQRRPWSRRPKQGHAAWRMETRDGSTSATSCRRSPKQGHAARRMEASRRSLSGLRQQQGKGGSVGRDYADRDVVNR